MEIVVSRKINGFKGRLHMRIKWASTDVLKGTAKCQLAGLFCTINLVRLYTCRLQNAFLSWKNESKSFSVSHFYIVFIFSGNSGETYSENPALNSFYILNYLWDGEIIES